MITIINEKSSQANDFADVLGGRTGVMPDFSNLAGEEYTIQEAAGHITSFKPLLNMVPEDRASEFSTWDYNELPFDRQAIHFQKELNPHSLGKGSKYYMSIFKRLLAQSDKVVIATDNDPSGEGDMIGWEIIDYCNFHGDVYRCDNIENGIKEAVANLRKIDRTDGLIKRAEAREKFDYLTIQYVRIATDEARKQQVLPTKAIIRTGRLKGAMVQLVGNQQRLHDSFIPHSSFIPTLFDEDGHKFLKKDAPEYKTTEEAKQHLDSLPSDAKIQEVDKRKVGTRPPKMLDLGSVSAKLEKEGYSSEEVQKLAEDMYTAKYLSYPRTEDEGITKDQLEKELPFIEKFADLVGVDKSLLDKNHFNEKILVKKASHGANRPSEKHVPESMDEIEQQFGKTGVALYIALTKSFLAEFAPQKISERHIYADDKTGQYKYTVTKVIDEGWQKVLGKEKPDNDEAEEQDDKLLTVGAPLHGDVYEKKATRPSLATWSMLNNYLKLNGIGTGATRLNTYNDIKKSVSGRQLLQVKSAKITLTKLGTISYIVMRGTELANTIMTERLEKYLKQVQTGQVTEQQILGLFDKMIVKDKDIMLKHQKDLAVLPKVKTITHQSIEGTYKPTGETKEIKDGISNHTFTKDEIEKLFNGETIDVMLKTKHGESKAQVKLNDDPKYGFGAHIIGWVKEEKPQYTGYSVDAGKEISFNKQFGSHTFTQAEADQLFDGKPVKFPAKSKRTGNTYDMKVKLAYETIYKSDKKSWHIVPIFENNKGKKQSYRKKK